MHPFPLLILNGLYSFSVGPPPGGLLGGLEHRPPRPVLEGEEAAEAEEGEEGDAVRPRGFRRLERKAATVSP